jgi:hypothetical protein
MLSVHIVARLRMPGATPSLSHASSWSGAYLRYIYHIITMEQHALMGTCHNPLVQCMTRFLT